MSQPPSDDVRAELRAAIAHDRKVLGEVFPLLERGLSEQEIAREWPPPSHPSPFGARQSLRRGDVRRVEKFSVAKAAHGAPHFVGTDDHPANHRVVESMTRPGSCVAG